MGFQILPPAALTERVWKMASAGQETLYILTSRIELCRNSAKTTLCGVWLEIIEENCHLKVS